MKTYRVSIGVDSDDVAAFVAYYKAIYGEEPKNLDKALRQSLRDALDGKVSDWHETKQMQEEPW